MWFSDLQKCFWCWLSWIFKSTWYIHPTMLWNPPLSLKYSWQSHLITRCWLMLFSDLKNAFDADYHGIFYLLHTATVYHNDNKFTSLQDIDWCYFRILKNPSMLIIMENSICCILLLSIIMTISSSHYKILIDIIFGFKKCLWCWLSLNIQVYIICTSNNIVEPPLPPILISLISLQDMDWWYFRV